jgi:hydrogenase 3 maturation protease
MKQEETALQIKNRIDGKVALVGIGNPLRGDDGFGPKLIEALKEGGLKVSLFDCGTAPENYIIPILDSSPSTVILLDAADFGSQPGAVGVFDMHEVENVSFSTHNTSPRLLADLFRTGNSALNIFMVVAQPRNIAFGENLSDEMKKAIETLSGIFLEIL